MRELEGDAVMRGFRTKFCWVLFVASVSLSLQDLDAECGDIFLWWSKSAVDLFSKLPGT